MKIMFVCTGNTCRSPMAEGFMRKLCENSLIDISVISRGLAVVPKSNVSINSVIAAKKFDVDINNHVPTQLNECDIASADIVFGVTEAHKYFIVSKFPQYVDRVYSISEFSQSGDIADPYGCDEKTYIQCAGQLHDAVKKIFEKIVDRNADNI